MTLFVKISAIGSSGILLLSGYRLHQLEERRALLNKEYEEIANKMECLQRDRANGMQEVMKREMWRVTREKTVDIVWKDRLERFREKIRELRDCILALPESLSVIQGVAAHCRYMATAMKDSSDFDSAVASTHNMGLLLSSNHLNGASSSSSSSRLTPGEGGLRVACGTLRHLFPQNDFLDAVCTSVENVKSIGVPQRLEEVSRSFQFCMEQLDEARNRALEHQAVSVSSLGDPSSSLSMSSFPFKKNRLDARDTYDSSPTSLGFSAMTKNSILIKIIHASLQKLKVSANDNDDVHGSRYQQLGKQKVRFSLDDFFQKEIYHLRTHEDVKAAMAYVEKLQKEIRDYSGIRERRRENVEKRASLPTKKGGFQPHKGEKEDLLFAMRKNHEVQLALQQAEVWKNAAATFLLEEQARSALSSYHVLMMESLARESIAV